jgi:PHD/YefM family antitoxin component YafN of YafNO toxin-antitoxin module
MNRAVAARQQVAESLRDKVQTEAAKVLEEELEEANVTDLRNGLLPTIERIQENPAIKVVIRKHGKRRAVLMSAPAYDALMHAASLFVEANDRLSPQEKLEAAYQRLESSGSSEQAVGAEPEMVCSVGTSPSQGKELKILLENAQQILRELDDRLGLGVKP